MIKLIRFSAKGATIGGVSRHTPRKVLGFFTGAIVGIPICMVRKSIDEEKYAIDGIVGDHDTKLWKVCAGTFWLPFSIVTGVAESPVSSTFISFKNSDKPFSKSQFSIAGVHPSNSSNNSTGATGIGPAGPNGVPVDSSGSAAPASSSPPP